MTQKTRQTIIVIVAIIAIFVGYRVFFVSSDSSSSSLSVSDSNAKQFADGQTILALLNKLNKVKLNTAVFSDKTFVSLTSFSVPIGEQVVGRKNPFLPIGTDSAGSAVSSTGSTTTRK